MQIPDLLCAVNKLFYISTKTVSKYITYFAEKINHIMYPQELLRMQDLLCGIT